MATPAKRKRHHPAKRKTRAVGKVSRPRTVVVAGKKRRKRRVSGLTQHQKPMEVAKMLVGSIVGGSIGAIIYSRVPGSNMMKGGVQLAAGAAGMMYMNEKTHPFLYGVATGVGTGGGVNLLHGLGVIHGVEEAVAGLFDGMSGTISEERYIPSQTAGHHHLFGRGHEHADGNMHFPGSYVSAITREDINQWVTEGVPGLGAEDWRG